MALFGQLMFVCLWVCFPFIFFFNLRHSLFRSIQQNSLWYSSESFMLCLNLFYAACSDWKHPLSPPQINLPHLWCFHAFTSFCHGWKCHLRGVLPKKIIIIRIILLQRKLTGIIAHAPKTQKNKWEKMKPYHLNLHFQIWPRRFSLFLLVGFHCRPGQKAKGLK